MVVLDHLLPRLCGGHETEAPQQRAGGWAIDHEREERDAAHHAEELGRAFSELVFGTHGVREMFYAQRPGETRSGGHRATRNTHTDMRGFVGEEPGPASPEVLLTYFGVQGHGQGDPHGSTQAAVTHEHGLPLKRTSSVR